MTQSVQLAQYGSQGVALGFKNRIINGAMVIDQRNNGSQYTFGSTGGIYTLDRWRAYLSQASKFTVQQNANSASLPIGFANYLGVVSTSAYSIVSTDIFSMQQFIEGYNIADLGWGTANAKTVTLSFWVQSSLTGTFGGSLQNSDQNRSYPFIYTISSANTWTQINITVAGDTTGSWLTTNGRGLTVWFGLGVGSTNSGTAGSWSANVYYSATGAVSLVGTSGATFYITGVQLEVGSSATGFEYRQYTTELQLCQRYYEKSYDIGVAPASNTALGSVTLFCNGTLNGYMAGGRQFSVAKRTASTVTIYNCPGTSGRVSDGNTSDYAAGGANQIGTSAFSLQNTSGATYSPTGPLLYFHYTASAEL